MIRIANLCKVYPGGVRALAGVNLDVGKGEFVALLGLSGAGKSTLLRCVNGLVRPTSGEVSVGGVVIDHRSRELRRLRRRVAMVFQQFNLVRRLSVLENVLCGRLAYCDLWRSCCRAWPRVDQELAWQALDRVGLAEKAFARADRLSGGQQQRVGIARALVQQPEVLLADEPVASLDPRSARTVLGLLRRINLEDGLTLLVSLHDVEIGLEYASRVVGLQGGRVVLDRKARGVTREDLDRLYAEDAPPPPEAPAAAGEMAYA